MNTKKFFELLNSSDVGYVDEMLSNDSDVVSATGYTGLTPSAVTSDEIADNYNDINNYPYFRNEKALRSYPSKK